MNTDKEDTIITVNVGNKLFSSHKKVLEKALYFNGLFNVHTDSKTDYTDNFIDRDPDIFGYLLNCLRDSNYIDIQKLMSYKPDLLYFQIECLLAILENNKTDILQVEKVHNDAQFEIIGKVVRILKCVNVFESIINSHYDTGLRIIIPENYIGSLSCLTNKSGMYQTNYSSGVYDNFVIPLTDNRLIEENLSFELTILKRD